MEECYAKSNKKSGLGQTVLEHCICVGKMAIELAKYFNYNNVPLNQIGFICATHDIGKLAPVFQFKINNDKLIKTLFGNNHIFYKQNINKDQADQEFGYHCGLGLIYLNKFRYKNKDIKKIISRHHGYSVDVNDKGNINNMTWHENEFGNKKDMKNIVDKFISELENVFNVKYDHIVPLLGIDLDIISSILSLSDWMCSKEYFNIHDINNINYKNTLTKNGFTELTLNNKKDREIFGFDLYDYQNETVNQINDYGFYMIEMGTGNGKTEIALKSAYTLINSKKCNGMVFALPTQVTSNAIFKRVENFISNVASSKESVNLMHSNAVLALYEMGKQIDDDKSNNDVKSFLNHVKHCRLFNNIITCTVDQLLLGVLNSKFNFMRINALWHKVIIIDEIHCYDAYTTRLIRQLSEICKKMECVVIALSATVSDSLKTELFDKKSFKKNYPLLTYETKNGNFVEYPVKGVSFNKQLNIILSHDEDKSIQDAIRDAIDGKQVLWIENTVTKAQNIYKKIESNLGINNHIETGLLHSKFTQNDRLKNELYWLKIWGKNDFNNERNKSGRILISTQVAEQSLDIDADKLYTRLCPIDAFGQRCGRVGRFGRKENKFDIVVLSEYSCKDYQTNSKLHWFFNKQFYEYSEFIYPKVILYKTLEYLEKHTVINYPDDYRSQLNYVYDNLCEINGFVKFNDALQEYYNQIKINCEEANKLISKHGETISNANVRTRNITNKGYSVLLYKYKHGDVINLYSGYTIDLSKKSFSIDDKINIEKNIVDVPIKNDLKSFGKLNDFEKLDDINFTAEVINNQIILNNDLDAKFCDYYYNSKEGVMKLI